MIFSGIWITIKPMWTPQIQLDRKTYPHSRVVGYARVSTVDQDPMMQIDALRKAGVKDDELFQEKVSAMAKRRHQLDLAIKALQPGDIFVIWKYDRIGRTVADLWRRINEVKAQGARFICLTQLVDTDTAAGKLMVTVIGGVAEFELDLIRERTAAGMAARAARGQHMGRPPKFTAERVEKLRRLLKAGKSIAQAAHQMKLSQAGIRSRFKIERKGRKIIITDKRK